MSTATMSMLIMVYLFLNYFVIVYYVIMSLCLLCYYVFMFTMLLCLYVYYVFYQETVSLYPLW